MTTRIPTVDLALVGVAVVWGSSYLAAKTLVTPETAYPMLVIRFAIAATALAALLAPRLRSVTRAEVFAGSVFGALLAVILAFETLGVIRTSASNAGLIIALTMVLTPLMDRRGSGRRLPVSFLCATAVAVTGVAVLTQTGAGFSAPNSGDVLIIGAAFARAVHVTVIARMSADRLLDSGRVTLVQLLVVAAVFGAISGRDGLGVAAVAARMTATDWLLMVYLALCCTVFAFLVQMWAVRRTSPSRVSLLLGTEPIWAAVTGVALAGDAVTVAGVVGAILILSGTNWARRIESRSGAAAEIALAQGASRTSAAGMQFRRGCGGLQESHHLNHDDTALAYPSTSLEVSTARDNRDLEDTP